MNKCQLLNLTIQRLCNSGTDPNIVLLLPLNGNITDYSVNGYVANTHGTVTYVEGYFPDTTAYEISDGNYIEYFVPSLTGTFSADFFTWFNTTNGRNIKIGSYQFQTSESTQYGGVVEMNYNTNEGINSQLKYAFTKNTWYHIAITRDESDTVRLFVNGSYVSSMNSASTYGARIAFDNGQVLSGRTERISNFRLTKEVLHEENNGLYTFPVPTKLYV